MHTLIKENYFSFFATTTPEVLNILLVFFSITGKPLCILKEWCINQSDKYLNYNKRSPRQRARYWNSKMVLKDDYFGLNCLVGCINIFLIFYLLDQNVAIFPAVRQTVWDSKSYYIGQFQIFCTPVYNWKHHI